MSPGATILIGGDFLLIPDMDKKRSLTDAVPGGNPFTGGRWLGDLV